MYDTNELTYTFLVVKERNDTIYEDLASLLNVRLAYLGHFRFPFIPFEKFETLSNIDKLFIHGPAGSGKSRCIFEILKKNLNQYRRIFVINPRSTTLCEHGSSTLTDIISKFGEHDAVVWDNFPDDLRKRDLGNSIMALELISSRPTKQLLVSLKPKYLEVFASLTDNIPEFYPFGISYSKEEFKEILKSYGANIPQYQNSYHQLIEPNLEIVAKTLWQKEPTPLTILDYYNEVVIREAEIVKTSGKSEMIQKHVEGGTPDSLSLAEKLPRSTNYYDHQFVLLNNMKDRTSDVEFLYTLKLCYELQLDRNRSTIEQLQREIFGSTLKSYPRLRNWIYLSGQICSMHDVCRDVINLTDDLKSKFLHYISINFSKIVSNDNPGTVNAVALFLGRNVQYLPRDKAQPFLPETIYKYMKMNAQFEKWIGHGVGEVFESLDEDLQKIITFRVDTDIHFAVGIGESLGYRFSSLKKENPILKKINDDFLFARYFGQSLGRLFPYLPDDLRREVSYSSEHNPQLSDGLGMGIGFMYGNLSPDLKREMFSKAETNSEMMRGLGYGFGLRFSELEENSQDEVFSIGNLWSEFDFGLGFALGEQYKNIGLLRKRVLDRVATRPLFSFGLGLYAGFADPNNCPTELMMKMKFNGGLAFGLGLGFGISFDYLTQESRALLLLEAKRNIRFDIGLGEGFGLVFNLQDEERRKKYLLEVDSYAALAEGLATGVGNTWIYNGSDIRENAISKIRANNLFAYGLGFGVGHRMSYLDGESRSDVFMMADRNSEMDKGLGLGLGMVFPYLGIFKNEILSRAQKKASFAYGLGTGLGWIFMYLRTEIKEGIQSICSSNRKFARGLGYGIGIYTTNHCDDRVIDQFVYKTGEDTEFAHGLGEGLGYSFGYLRKSLRKKILGYGMTSPQFAKGLGVGLGRTFSYLPPQFQSTIFRRAEYNVNFAEGLGEGMGVTFAYMNETQQNQLFSKAISESAFMRGVGIGLGSIFDYLSPKIQDDIMFRRTIQNSQLTKGLGIGLGSIFNYLSAQLQSTIFRRSEGDDNFAEGLGEGLGSIFAYVDNPIRKELTHRVTEKRSSGFGIGVGIGFGLTCKSPDTCLSEIIDSLMNSDFARGFGIGTADVFHYFSKNYQNSLSLLKLVEKHGEFAESFGFGLGHLFSYMNVNDRTKLTREEEHPFKDTRFAYGLGKGLGHDFLHMDERLKEQVFEKVAYDHFALGLGEGLGRIYDSLEGVVQNKLLEYARLYSTFAYGLGKGLGLGFPSMSRNVQSRVLNIAEGATSFSLGLMTWLEGVAPYLDEDIGNAMQTFIERHRYDSSFRLDWARGYHDDAIYNEYPVVGLKGRVRQKVQQQQQEQQIQTSLPLTRKEIVFLGRRRSYCVFFVDIVSSTIITNTLKREQIQSYYATFLNAMATISKNFNAQIIKSQGDALFLYFPRTGLASTKPVDFKGVLECGITMLAAHKSINATLYDQKLPPLHYRISADYGILEEARSSSSKGLDLFGPAMNLCVKINSKAPKNEMVIGHELYDKVKSFSDIYSFKEEEGITQGDDVRAYRVYKVIGKGRDILNPFEHRLI